MKKIAAILLALSCMIFAVSCRNRAEPEPGTADESGSAEVSGSVTEPGGKQPEPEEPMKYTSYSLNSSTKGVRILGVRNLESSSQINCDWTCSGIELNLQCSGGDISFRIATKDSKPAYFRVWLDGAAWEKNDGDVYYKISGSENLIMRDVPAGAHTVRLLKVTGYTLAQAQILSVKLCGTISEAAPVESERYIEFVGDSISCGWGTIGNHGGAYTDQDGTYAYPYLLAQALGADYSVTALSGQGLCCGTPGMTQGYLYDCPSKGSVPSAFARKADLVVINIGTNDFVHRAELGLDEEGYRQAYTAFLRTVREKNGEDCKILCLYNTMNDTFANAIISSCEAMGGSAAGIFHLRLERAENNGHPTIAEHEAYAAVLQPLIEKIFQAEGSSMTLTESGDGDLDVIDFRAGKNNR